MYAIVTIGGNQYRVQSGMSLVVDKMIGKVGEKVTLPALLVVDNTHVKMGVEAARIQVLATITGFSQGKKIDVSRFRAKSKHRRHIGFRAQLTQLTVETIGEVKKTPSVKSKTSIKTTKAK